MALAGIERQLLAAALAWLGAWAVRPRRPDWPWTRHAGLALVLYPFLRMAVGAIIAAPLVVQPTVARAIPRAQLWSTATEPLLDKVLLPGLGVLLATGNLPGLQRPLGRAREALADAWRRAGLGPLETTREGTLAGLALFFPVAAAFGLALAFRSTPVGQLLVTGDESQVFVEVTVPLALALSIGPPLAEELLFRGLLLGQLVRRVGVAAGIAGQAVFFGLIHAGYGTLAHVVAPTAFGLALGWVALRVGLGAAVALHAEANLLFFAAELAADPAAVALLLVPVALLSLWALARTGLAPLLAILETGEPEGVGADPGPNPPWD
jgi:membrane protease YdiL (CAAX protease family)